jgi:predicted nicotinamide N-methyase
MELTLSEIRVGPHRLCIRHPPDAAALIDEAAFDQDEFLPYWAELWPSGIVLARHAERLVGAGERVVELGCGLGLPSLAAALAGAQVLATDWSPDALALLQRNARENGAALETAAVRWDDAGVIAASGPWDVVLAADVVYERRNVAPLAALLPRLVAGGRVLLADPGRPAAKELLAELATWTSEELPADSDHPRVTTTVLRKPG